jgi:ribosomal protein S27AE
MPDRSHFVDIWDPNLGKTEKAKTAPLTEGELTRRLEKLTLICRAMWTLLQERTQVTERELAARMTEIDLLDGKADGRVSVPARKCTACGHLIAPHHDRCLYCGGKKLVKSVFETV